MKITLKEISEMQAGLDVILGKELPIKASYWLARFLDKVRSEIGATEKIRMQLIDKYAKKDKDGKFIFKKDSKGKDLGEYDFTKENLIKFGKEYTELSEVEMEIDFKPIKISDLGDITIKPIVLLQLKKIIEE